MFKFFIIILFMFAFLKADSFHFLEKRYSSALDASIEFEGSIEFEINSLQISYIKQDKSLSYKAGNIVYKEAQEEVELPSEIKAKLVQYFEILILLHFGNEEVLRKTFEVNKNKDKTVLKPLGSLAHYIKKISLIKNEGVLKEVKLFLQNEDTIKISISNALP